MQILSSADIHNSHSLFPDRHFDSSLEVLSHPVMGLRRRQASSINNAIVNFPPAVVSPSISQTRLLRVSPEQTHENQNRLFVKDIKDVANTSRCANVTWMQRIGLDSLA